MKPHELFPEIDPAFLPSAALHYLERGYRYAGRWDSVSAWAEDGPEQLGLIDRQPATNEQLVVCISESNCPLADTPVHVLVHPYYFEPASA